MSLADWLAGSPYQGYSYGYPHKTAYRPLTPPAPLADAWAGENRASLFLYLHVPFCEMRCGFCNLFTQPQPQQEIVAGYLQALRRQAAVVREALGPARFARCAIGGGTPTFLAVDELAGLLDIARILGVDLAAAPTSIEVSPETVTPDRLALLRQHGVERVSIGVQSFFEDETSAVARPQQRAVVERTLEQLRTAGFPTLNIDLIYGLPGQDRGRWLQSLEAALAYRPEELYLYPLYVRPLTGLGKSSRQWDDGRLDCYRAAVDVLTARGYRQESMRFFRRADAPSTGGPVYCCQDDGMVGLGCGARSYTRRLHYSTEFAVGQRGVRAIIADFNARSDSAFAHADHGFMLDVAEQRRRFVIQSLLQTTGLDAAAYRRRFGSELSSDFSQLGELVDLGLATASDGVRLTGAGLERSDVIGPWLYSDDVRQRMAEYELR